ncbi:MAG TPA: hypothetical protein VKK06_19355 [Terriglobia bacterium]|jgi:hypothetical protein|nr:hypothetical protein [Terriglobia bacterium]
MMKVAIIMLLAALPNLHASPLQQRQQRLGNERPRAALRRSVAEDAVYAFYVRQFQQDTDVTPEVFSKILPFIDQFLKDRFEISQRRTRALSQLRQAIQRNGSEDELKRLIRELDAADSEFQANQEKFLTNVDPLLNLRQRAKVRVLQNMADNRIRQYLNAVQNPDQRQGAGPDRAQD